MDTTYALVLLVLIIGVQFYATQLLNKILHYVKWLSINSSHTVDECFTDEVPFEVSRVTDRAAGEGKKHSSCSC